MKGILLLLVQCLLPIFIKTPAAIIVSQGSHKKQKAGVNFKATCNLSIPFFGTFIASGSKTNLRAIHLEFFFDKILLHGKFLSFVPLKQKKALWKLFSPEISQFFMTRS